MSYRGALLRPSEKGERRPTASRSIAKGSRYETLKETVRTWMDDRFKVGEALKEIQTGNLYQKEYATFEDFCEEEFGLKVRQAYRLIEAAEIKESLRQIGHKKINENGTSGVADSTIVEKLVNPSQAHALAAVPEEKRVDVLTEAAKAPGPVTAKRITQAAKSSGHATPKVQKVIELDKTGYPIPASILEDWQRASEWSKEILSLVSDARSKLKSALEDQDLILTEVTNSTVADLNNAYTSLKCVTPYAVCASCQGHQRKTCTLCKRRGFISQFLWNQVVPEETKKLREMGSAK